jgi:hypothetical protein
MVTTPNDGAQGRCLGLFPGAFPPDYSLGLLPGTVRSAAPSPSCFSLLPFPLRRIDGFRSFHDHHVEFAPCRQQRFPPGGW